jgi:putative acetyltransferase
MITISAVETEHEIDRVRSLFREYESELAHLISGSLCAQGFEEEVAGLPGKYAPPRGALLLAREGDRLAGCVAMRDLGDGVCEMKRLYVVPEYRKGGLGRRLAEALIDEATAVGYDRMRLDSLSEMTAAVALYRELGFEDIPPYWDNPIPHSVHMEKTLRPE